MYQVYQTSSGDTIETIAKKFNISVDELKNINNDLKNPLVPGMLVVVPSLYNNFTKYVIKEGDTIYKIASTYNVDPNVLILLNGLKKDDYIYPGEIILIPKEGISVYITKEGNTIEDLITLGNFNNIMNLNSKIYLLPDQVVLYKKEV